MKSTYFKRTGHERYRVAKASTNSAATGRRKRALERLEAQLESGNSSRIDPNIKGLNTFLPLSEEDIKRIKKEIGILKTRT